ncbi:MAG: NUDIX hydrolase [Candidatus Rifleibacteriota bacterium]
MKNIAIAVVVRDGKVLVQERFRRNRGMVFEFPGGSIDQDETPEQAAIRELWEETGLENLSIAGHYQGQNEFGGIVHFIVLNAPPDAEPQIIEPARRQTFFWFKLSQIPKKDFCKADLQFIETSLENFV